MCIASIATLLSYALLDEDKPDGFKGSDFETFAVAPLPCISSETCPEEIKERVVTLISRTDMVPRLTPQKLEACQAFFSAIGGLVEAPRLVESCVSPQALSSEILAHVGRALNQSPGVVNALEMEEVDENSPRHVGQVYWLEDGSCKVVSSSMLERLSLYENPEFVLGHELSGYASCLKSLK